MRTDSRSSRSSLLSATNGENWRPSPMASPIGVGLQSGNNSDKSRSRASERNPVSAKGRVSADTGPSRETVTLSTKPFSRLTTHLDTPKHRGFLCISSEEIATNTH